MQAIPNRDNRANVVPIDSKNNVSKNVQPIIETTTQLYKHPNLGALNDGNAIFVISGKICFGPFFEQKTLFCRENLQRMPMWVSVGVSRQGTSMIARRRRRWAQSSVTQGWHDDDDGAIIEYSARKPSELGTVQRSDMF